MPPSQLDEYNRKRDFKKTPEPRGETATGKAGFSFCIQKHAATRLHYDFRLELDGVLKSWAVPKGPSYDTADKRLAMRTEDHPLDYGGFEGIIPAGEYGGGTVLLWDRGTWEPLEDPHTGMAKGALKFRLHGEKLQGKWTLVKIRSRDPKEAEKTWLLIKERDEKVRPAAKYDVTEARPESVLSGRDMDQVAADRDRVWSSSEGEVKTTKRKAASTKTAPAKAPALPRFAPPQLATLADAPPSGDEWLHEIKFDGYRIQARRDDRAVTLLSRNEKDYTKTFATLAAAIGRLPCRTALVDGEAAVLLPDGKTSFNGLQNAMAGDAAGPLVYLAFDLLHLDGKDLRSLPLEERKALLAKLVERAGPAAEPIRYSDHVVGAGQAFFEQACAMQLEGILSKRRDDPYRAGRARTWLKIKCSNEQELVIAGFTEAESNRKDLGALLLAVNEDGELRYAGKVGTGFTERSAEELLRKLRALEVDAAPFAKRPAGLKKVHWVKPRLVAQVQFTEWTPDGALRHPSFKGLREDKAPADVVREVEQPVAKVATRPKEVDAVGGVRMTHPERILYPALKLTKRELAEYYVAIAEWILPHLAGRPTSLVRCPEGVAKKCFYQKHGAETAPPELRRVAIEERKKTEDYLVADDEPGLVALAQMSILEIHTWNCQADALETPDRVVFDLDPDEALPWSKVVAGARLVKETLEGLKLKSFVKTTGGKGLHVVVPLLPGPSWDEMFAFSETVSKWIAGAHSKEYVAIMSKARRVGRIYIDYQRNQRGATSVCGFSTRARPDASVSVPLHWDELEARSKPDFTIRNVPKRLAGLKADPWKGYATLKQRLPQP